MTQIIRLIMVTAVAGGLAWFLGNTVLHGITTGAIRHTDTTRLFAQKGNETVNDYRLLIDLHKQGHRQGPGGDSETKLAINIAMIDRTVPLKVADIGCGTGASTLVLARLLNAQIIAVDFLQDFLDVLIERAERAGIADMISTLACSMDNLPFANEELDIIWSEGAVYNIGFEKGVAEWRRFLKAGGLLVASEITWLTDSRYSGRPKPLG